MSIDRLSSFHVKFDLDLLEKTAMLALAAFAIGRLAPPIAEGAYQNAIILVCETLSVIFIILRRSPKDLSIRPVDWLAGFVASILPQCILSAEGPPLLPMWFCGLLMTAGFAFSVAAKLVLRRSLGIVAANRGVKISGPYRLVRHPMYAGYTVLHIGYLLSGPTLWNTMMYGTSLALQIYRILAEERILRQDPAYRDLCSRVRYRLLPGVF